ncbi:hypothetical protein ABW20_dc0109120 [Dactylellina cionopaga]|nr:hypothetical protein ABW20_dc0109120 [Dactylellina cionopaga]
MINNEKPNETKKENTENSDNDVVSLLATAATLLSVYISSTVRLFYTKFHETLELSVVASWMLLMPLSILLQIITILNPFLWPYWLWIQIDSAPVKGGREFKPFRRLFIWKLFRDYYPVHLEAEETLSSDRSYFFIAHPHGIMPMGLWCNFSTEANRVSQKLPGLSFKMCTLESNFKVPFLRDILMALGCIPVSEASIRYCLSRRDKPTAVIDVVGGSAESLDQRPGNVKLTIRKRTGFLRIAIEEGVDLVPVFTFGENDTFYQKDNPRGSWLRLFQEGGKKILGMAPTLFWGRALGDQPWGFFPMRRKVTSVVGKPVKVPRLPDGVKEVPEEMIDKLREDYITELKSLFERWKHLSSGNEIELDIVA